MLASLNGVGQTGEVHSLENTRTCRSQCSQHQYQRLASCILLRFHWRGVMSSRKSFKSETPKTTQHRLQIPSGLQQLTASWCRLHARSIPITAYIHTPPYAQTSPLPLLVLVISNTPIPLLSVSARLSGATASLRATRNSFPSSAVLVDAGTGHPGHAAVGPCVHRLLVFDGDCGSRLLLLASDDVVVVVSSHERRERLENVAPCTLHALSESEPWLFSACCELARDMCWCCCWAR